MGKHDKESLFKWDEPTGGSYTEAENKKLRAENERLKTIIKAMEKDAARMDKAYDRTSDKTDSIIAQKDKEIAFWKYKAMKLVEKHV